MNSNKTLYTIIVHSENIAGILNQITAVFTRRQINIESLNVSASSIKGVHKYTITCWTTPDVIDKVVTQIEKKIDVIQAHYFTDKEIFQREVAMYKVATPEFQANPEASKENTDKKAYCRNQYSCRDNCSYIHTSPLLKSVLKIRRRQLPSVRLSAEL